MEGSFSRSSTVQQYPQHNNIIAIQQPENFLLSLGITYLDNVLLVSPDEAEFKDKCSPVLLNAVYVYRNLNNTFKYFDITCLDVTEQLPLNRHYNTMRLRIQIFALVVQLHWKLPGFTIKYKELPAFCMYNNYYRYTVFSFRDILWLILQLLWVIITHLLGIFVFYGDSP